MQPRIAKSSFKDNEKISGRPAFWSICWIDLLNEVLLALTSEDISLGFRDYQFPGPHPIQASIDGNYEAVEQPELISVFAL
jgi:hypothetical protein